MRWKQPQWFQFAGSASSRLRYRQAKRLEQVRERERSSLRIERENFLGRPVLRFGCYWAVPWHVLGKYLSVAPQCDFLKGTEVLACLRSGGLSELKAAASLLAPGQVSAVEV